MSIRSLISSFRGSTAKNPVLNLASDAQRREWLRSALETLTASKAIEKHSAELTIGAADAQAILPRDYLTADDMALLAVEYAFSTEYALEQGIDLDFYGYNVSRPIAAHNVTPSYLRPLPKPRVSEASLYGKTRKALALRGTQSARTEILVYCARWSVEDARIEIALASQPNDGDTVAITVRGLTDTVYTYTAESGTVDAGEFKIGQSKAATAINLAAVIAAASSTTGLTAEAIGEIASVYGATADKDFTIETDGVRLIVEEIPAYSNLDDGARARIFKLWQAEQFDYFSTETAVELSDPLRQIYFQKAERLRREALELYQTLTV